VAARSFFENKMVALLNYKRMSSTSTEAKHLWIDTISTHLSFNWTVPLSPFFASGGQGETLPVATVV
jgi:hypothetical protein